MSEDRDYRRGDDRFMRGAPDKKHKPGGCLEAFIACVLISAVVLVKPFFRR